MSILYADVPATDPNPVRQACQEQGLPTDWYGRTNFFRVPTGRGPGTGAVLLTGDDLDDIDLTTDHTLTFLDDQGNSRTLQKITLLKARCLTPGYAGDGRATFLCDLADRRWFLSKIPVDKAYNVSSADGTSYLTSSTNGGSAWTWQTLVQDLYTTLGLGAAPALPYTYTANPENLKFFAGFAWEALNQVLDALGCTIKYDPVADTFSVLKLGDTAAAAAVAGAALLAQLDRAADKTWDAYWQEPNRGKLPEKVRVTFPRRPQPTDGTSTFYTVDVTLAAAEGVQAGTYEQLHDGLTAVGSGTPTNAAALSTRASEVAARWLAKRLYSEARQTLVYRDFQDAPKLLSETTGEVALDDRGAMMGTAVASAPDGLWGRPYEQPLVLTQDDDTAGPAGPAGWDSATCLVFDVSAGSGRCSGVAAQAIPATYNAAAAAWVGSSLVTTDTGTWEAVYDWPDGACCPELTLSEQGGSGVSGSGLPGTVVKMKYVGCEGGGPVFASADPQLCGGTKAADCADNTFRVGVRCVPCEGLSLPCCSPPVTISARNLCVNVASTSSGTCPAVFDGVQQIVPLLSAGTDLWVWSITFPAKETAVGGDPCRPCTNTTGVVNSYIVVQVSAADCKVYVQFGTNCEPVGGSIYASSAVVACDLANTGSVVIPVNGGGMGTYDVTVSTDPTDCPSPPPPVTTYNCVAGVCTGVSGTGGTYATVADCIAHGCGGGGSGACLCSAVLGPGASVRLTFPAGFPGVGGVDIGGSYDSTLDASGTRATFATADGSTATVSCDTGTGVWTLTYPTGGDATMDPGYSCGPPASITFGGGAITFISL